jgi:hypothetical protein
VALYTYALAAAPFRRWQPRVAVLLALPLLAGSGAPSMALVMGLGGAEVCRRSSYAPVQGFLRWVLAATALAAGLAVLLGSWHWRAVAPVPQDWITIPRQWLWFLWPAWPLALWTLWRWRHFLGNRHLAVPLVVAGTALAANLVMAGADRALMLGAAGAGGAGRVCAADAAPQRLGSHRLVLDVLLHRRGDHDLGAVQRHADRRAGQTRGQHRAPGAGFRGQLLPLALAVAAAGTLAWLWLLRWRTGRHREALWKSLVLPASGVALCWLLTMTLLLPPLDYARSQRALIERIAQHVPRQACIAGPGLSPTLVAALEYLGRWRVDARSSAADGAGCDHLLRVTRLRTLPPPPDGWTLAADLRRPTDRDERTLVYRRQR